MVRWSEFAEKEIICCHDGSRLGFADDLMLDPCTGRIVSLLVPTGGKFCGLIGKGDELIIEWNEIEKIGEDIILVNKVIECSSSSRKKYCK